MHIPIKADHLRKLGQVMLCEESRATIGVDQKRLVRRNQSRHRVGQMVRDGVVRLGKDAWPALRAQGVVTVARAPGAERGQLVVHRGFGDRAAFDVDQPMRVVPEKTDDAVLDVDRDAVAIFVLLRRRNDWTQGRLAKFSDAPQRLLDLTRFPVQLMLVAHVLIAASAAAPEIGTARRCALRRGFEHPDEFCLRERFLFPNDSGRDPLALDRERNKDRLALSPPNAFAAKGDVVDQQLEGSLHPPRLAEAASGVDAQEKDHDSREGSQLTNSASGCFDSEGNLFDRSLRRAAGHLGKRLIGLAHAELTEPGP